VAAADAMMVGNFALSNREKIVSPAALHKLPAIYPLRGLVRQGGLIMISYDADILECIVAVAHMSLEF
jgi:hypothetical protein